MVDFFRDRGNFLPPAVSPEKFSRNSVLLAISRRICYTVYEVMNDMETKDILLKLRTEKGLSQDELAEKMYVTRQAVSRWENGETTPNTETLKLLSRFYDVSINTLLGSPRRLICQCCGMPLEDAFLSRETDGGFNEEYCKWCYVDGKYVYSDMDELIEVCAKNMAEQNIPADQARTYLREMLPRLNYWKTYSSIGGETALSQWKRKVITEINALHIEGMPPVKQLYVLEGSYVNLEYTLPGGEKVRFLDDRATYMGAQLESEFGGDRCFGVIADMGFLLVCTYRENGADPELVLYKKR